MKKVLIITILTFLGYQTTHSQIVKTDQEVREIYDFVFGESSGKKLGRITKVDKDKATLFFAELVDKSCSMSYLETLTKTALNPASNLQTLVRNFALKHYKDCHKSIKEGKIYDSVRNTLKRNWKGAFEIRITTGEW